MRETPVDQDLNPDRIGSLSQSSLRIDPKFPLQGLYIHGEPVSAPSGSTFTNVCPATNQSLGEIQSASAEDIERAVVSAEQGFKIWSAMSGSQRGVILRRAAHLIRERVGSLAEMEVLDTGKPISEARSTDIPSAADALDYFAGIAGSIHGDHVDLGKSFAYTRREPLGVCLGIGAWNYPFQIACWKSAPALAAGNSMIFKPSELTPLTALQLARIFTEAGLPSGVFNVLQGPSSVGQALVSHPRIAKVSLTGSVATGKRVMALAAETLKQVTLELGGKSPLLIFDDARLEQAVSAALMANFYTQGEVCSNGTRVFVAEEIYDAFVDRVVSRVEKIRVGDPMDPQTQMGALISKEHLAKVQAYIELGKKEGATLLCGGRSLPGPGNFMRPAVFTNCNDSMTHVKEEIFGPVMSVLKFKTEDEAIARANLGAFGLAAGVFTQDIQRAHRVIAALQAGTCWINNYNITPVEVPFGGYRQSGLGRENGLAALHHYTQLKSVYVEMGDVESVF